MVLVRERLEHEWCSGTVANAKWWPSIVVSVKNKINLFASLIGVSEEFRTC